MTLKNIFFTFCVCDDRVSLTAADDLIFGYCLRLFFFFSSSFLFLAIFGGLDDDWLDGFVVEEERGSEF